MNRSRREFVTAAAVVTGAVAFGRLSLPVLANESAPDPAPAPVMLDAGPIANYKNQGVWDQYAKSHKLILISNEGKIYASSSLCTHKGCVLKPAEGQFRCPCHLSLFDIDGRVIKGKAKTSLVRYAVAVKDGNLFVDLQKDFEDGHWSEAGSFVAVPE